MIRFEIEASVPQNVFMTRRNTALATGDPSLEDEEPANEADTRAALLDRARRPFGVIPKVFVQKPRTFRDRAAPLSVFVNNGDFRALKAYLFLSAVISSGDHGDGWSVTLPLSVYARAFGTTRSAGPRAATSAASKILSRLAERKLIDRVRRGRERKIKVTLLRPDGTGAPYSRAKLATDDRYLKLTNVYWTGGWHDKLDLPATAMLLVALHEKPGGFELPTEHMQAWYGWSPDTAERGLRALVDHGLLHKRQRLKKAPLSPTGQALVNVYTLLPPFTPTSAAQPKETKKTKKRNRKPRTNRGAAA